jgi:hypothetical protein
MLHRSDVLLVILSSTITALLYVASERFLDRLRKLENRLKADEKATLVRPTDDEIRKYREHPSVSRCEMQEFLEYARKELPVKLAKLTVKLANRRPIFIFTILLATLLIVFFLLYIVLGEPLSWPYVNVAYYGLVMTVSPNALNSISQVIWYRKITKEFRSVTRELNTADMYLTILGY